MFLWTKIVHILSLLYSTKNDENIKNNKVVQNISPALLKSKKKQIQQSSTFPFDRQDLA